MPFRVRRSIKILPGIRWNFSKQGGSLSIGGRGANVTVGHGKVRETVSLPGTGVSYTDVREVHPLAPLLNGTPINESEFRKLVQAVHGIH